MKKNALIRHRSITFQSVCTKIKSSRTIGVEHRSAQKLHLFTIALLQILTYLSLVAWLLPFLSHHIRTVFIENFLFKCNYVATLICCCGASIKHQWLGHTNCLNRGVGDRYILRPIGCVFSTHPLSRGGWPRHTSRSNY